MSSLSFIQELRSFCQQSVLPLFLGGDFNLIRNNNERNQGQGDPRLMELFNNFIGDLFLREVFVTGQVYLV